MKLHRMPALALLTFLAIGASTASQAQYTGPNGAPRTVRQVMDSGWNYENVVLKGRILSRGPYEDTYQFSDGTATIAIKFDHDKKHGKGRWPLGLRIDDKTEVEIAGKFDREALGLSKIKVYDIRVVQ